MKGRVGKKVDVGGVILDSQKEAERYKQLKLFEQSGQIQNLVVHPSWRIDIGGIHICDYEADFSYSLKVHLPGLKPLVMIEDVKDFRIGKDGKIKWSSRTKEYMLKKKLMLAVHGISIVEWPERPKISRRRKNG